MDEAKTRRCQEIEIQKEQLDRDLDALHDQSFQKAEGERPGDRRNAYCRYYRDLLGGRELQARIDRLLEELSRVDPQLEDRKLWLGLLETKAVFNYTPAIQLSAMRDNEPPFADADERPFVEAARDAYQRICEIGQGRVTSALFPLGDCRWRLGDLAGAAEALEQFCEKSSNATKRDEAREILRQIRQRRDSGSATTLSAERRQAPPDPQPPPRVQESPGPSQQHPIHRIDPLSAFLKRLSSSRLVRVAATATVTVLLVFGALWFRGRRDTHAQPPLERAKAPAPSPVSDGKWGAAEPAAPQAPRPPPGPPSGLKMVAAVASSTRSPYRKYTPGLAIDGSSETAWNADRKSVGEWLRVALEGKREIAEIGIVAGYDKVRRDRWGDRWKINTRLKRVRLSFEDGQQREVQLSDTRPMQYFRLSARSSWVKITVLEVYPGSRFSDACISEVAVKGR